MLERNKAHHFMQVKYWIGVALMTVVCLLPTYDAQAQIMVTDENGDKIILMPDGSWRYADDEKQATAPKQVKEQQEKGKVKVDKKKLTKAERKALKKQRKDQKRREKILKKLEKQREREAQKADKGKKEKKGKKGKQPPKEKPAKKQNKPKSKAEKQSKAERKAAQKAQKQAQEKGSSKVTKAIKRSFKPFKSPEVVIYTPPCTYQMNEVDAFTGKRKIAVEPDFFFGYTHPRLERFMKGGHYLTCEAYVSEVASLRALNVKFIIDSPSAKNDYGVIQEGSRMLINLLDGETVVLASGEYNAGKVDPAQKQTIYSTYFIIDSKSERQLKRGEITQIRFVWSEGFEDYDIYEVDFIANQLKCLDAAQ